ncbi:MAG: hypothetical protein H5T60_12115 [Anaerolineae bacterium]|nr:hypothetical protein [Anaerolineae bacterium]
MLAIALCWGLPGFFLVSLIWPREEGLSTALHGNLNRDGMRALQWITQHAPAEYILHNPTCTDIITTHHVDVVLFAPAASVGGNLPDFAEGVNQAQLDSAPYLQNVAKFGGVYIYQVNYTLLGADTLPGQEVVP